jgi:hypothetical protein
VVVELFEQHEQQQRDDHPDGGFGKHIIHENSFDATSIFTYTETPILLVDFTRNALGVPHTARH